MFSGTLPIHCVIFPRTADGTGGGLTALYVAEMLHSVRSHRENPLSIGKMHIVAGTNPLAKFPSHLHIACHLVCSCRSLWKGPPCFCVVPDLGAYWHSVDFGLWPLTYSCFGYIFETSDICIIWQFLTRYHENLPFYYVLIWDWHYISFASLEKSVSNSFTDWTFMNSYGRRQKRCQEFSAHRGIILRVKEWLCQASLYNLEWCYLWHLESRAMSINSLIICVFIQPEVYGLEDRKTIGVWASCQLWVKKRSVLRAVHKGKSLERLVQSKIYFLFCNE